MRPTQPIAAWAGALAWLAGRWAGSVGADRIEEQWTEPYDGMLLGMFRWHRDGRPRFYELLSIEPEGEGLTFRIKHFDPGMSGWEEKDEAVTLDLVALQGQEAVFLKRGEARWMTYRLDGETNELAAWFETDDSPHVPEDEFRYSRG